MTIDSTRRPARTRGGSLHAQVRNEAGCPGSLEHVLAYHERTKHRLERYAAGPEALDWSSQPDPFRSFDGAPALPLPLAADRLTTPYSALCAPGAVTPQPVSLESIAALLELSLGLSAWKEYGPDRWALRCNPSSGNLHPTEGYVICRGIPTLEDGVHHYLSHNHSLEQRCRSRAVNRPEAPAGLWIGLSSIHWREAWKYGERAFRYCQLDVGHAIGALRYAAATLGWQLRLVEGVGWQAIAGQLGLDRREDFSGAEPEEAELLLEVIVDGEARTLASQHPAPGVDALPDPLWSGQANVLDPHPMYHWPVIDQVAEATRFESLTGDDGGIDAALPPAAATACNAPAASLIRQRRSAQRFDPHYDMPQGGFYAVLDALLPRPTAPWDVWTFTPRLHPVFFIHRVQGLAPGLYILLRNERVGERLRAAMHESFAWRKPPGCPEHLGFFHLLSANCGPAARTINCHQAIAADSCFALGMLAEYAAPVTAAPWRYRQLHWEAGLLGQTLYLEAEAIGLRGTGIGCYFDDSFHEILGLSGRSFQSLYHFTVGYPLTDSRILTLPPYPETG